MRQQSRSLLVVLAGILWIGAPAARAQTADPAADPHAGEVETEPITCWWKADRPMVFVGQPFTVTLTCAVVETSRIRVVPNRTELEPGTLQLTPFELVGGRGYEDISAPPWRYFQYAYTLRLLNDGFFGQDVDIPQLKVGYNVESLDNEGIRGRDQTYLLPPMSMRVMSLVPRSAGDIRDAYEGGFGDIEDRRFRSTQELVAALALFALAAVLAGLALVRLFGYYRARVPVARTLPARAMLGGCLAELGRLKADAAREGWTPDLAGRALAAFRLAGTLVLGRPVAQTSAEPGDAPREGQVLVRSGLLGRRRTVVSASATAGAIERRLAADSGRKANPQTRAALEEIREALAAFGAVRYGRDGRSGSDALDRALDQGTLAVRRLRRARLRPTRSAVTGARAASRVGGVEWSS